MNNFKVIKYLVDGNVGMSSKAVISQYIDVLGNKNYNHPHDCGDLKRCIDAVNSLDLDNVNHMKNISSQWFNISKKWNDLVISFNTDKNECYSLLQECLK